MRSLTSIGKPASIACGMQPKWPMAPMSKICPAGTAREPSWPWQVWGVGWRPSLLETKMKEKEERSYVLQIFRLWGVQVCGSRPFLRRQRWAGHGCAHRLGVSQHSKISRKKSCNDGLQPSNGLQPAMDCRRIQKANVTSERHGSATCPMEVK